MGATGGHCCCSPLLIWRGFIIVIQARDRFGSFMLVTGFIAQVGVQAHA